MDRKKKEKVKLKEIEKVDESVPSSSGSKEDGSSSEQGKNSSKEDGMTEAERRFEEIRRRRVSQILS